MVKKPLCIISKPISLEAITKCTRTPQPKKKNSKKKLKNKNKKFSGALYSAYRMLLAAHSNVIYCPSTFLTPHRRFPAARKLNDIVLHRPKPSLKSPKQEIRKQSRNHNKNCDSPIERTRSTGFDKHPKPCC